MSVRREGAAVILEPANEWPEGYVESFTGVPGLRLENWTRAQG